MAVAAQVQVEAVAREAAIARAVAAAVPAVAEEDNSEATADNETKKDYLCSSNAR